MLSNAFPKLTFSSPLALVSPADGTKRLFVVEQGGKIFVIKNNPAAKSKALFLDLSSRISRGGELGLLGLAFHPSFAENGKFYVNYTEPRSPGSAQSRSVISEFTRSSASSTDLSSERRLMELDQPFSNHNGGDLAFGPDGFLYIGFGDGGSGGDPQGNGQDRSVLLGKILRIDVDAQEGALAYAIPHDNPYKGNSSGFREEIFAYGFRNPFRISFDQETGRLWAGDVGQGAREEIDLVLSGGNYGWNTMEGSQCYPPGESCNTAGLVLPITEYGHDVGRSIIGGYVFSGRSIPNLRGHYIFGDFVTGIIFSLLYDGATATRKTLLQSGLSIASFGRDEDGEIYVVSYGDGKIYKIVPR
ncbi:MAG: PQQ-dependent sugar dehydrogenase [Deltaproteobacteria bacterium]|nr:PQQ-dependent sugar dehydrogenase [Deltaproteobacteria bacterium]